MVAPLTLTRPSAIMRSAARREATPASARSFCNRSGGITGSEDSRERRIGRNARDTAAFRHRPSLDSLDVGCEVDWGGARDEAANPIKIHRGGRRLKLHHPLRVDAATDHDFDA